MPRGPLGLPRLTSFGPMVNSSPRFKQDVSLDEMRQMVQEIVDENNIDPANADPGSEQFQTVVDELADELFTSERKQNRFKSCLQGTWSQGWATGFDSATFPDVDDIEGEESTSLEKLTLQATGCRSLVERNTIEAPP